MISATLGPSFASRYTLALWLLSASSESPSADCQPSELEGIIGAEQGCFSGPCECECECETMTRPARLSMPDPLPEHGSTPVSVSVSVGDAVESTESRRDGEADSSGTWFVSAQLQPSANSTPELHITHLPSRRALKKGLANHRISL
jgi:hypothetical protein